MYNETQHHQKQKAITTAPAIWGSSVDPVGADALIGQPRRDPSRAPSLMTHDCRNEATARPHPTSLGFKVSVKVERTTLNQSLRKNTVVLVALSVLWPHLCQATAGLIRFLATQRGARTWL